jgi:putative transposase
MAPSRLPMQPARPRASDLLPVYQELFSRPVVQGFVRSTPARLRWRLLTPLIVLWGLVFQRLSEDHTADAVVSYLHGGGADTVDPDPRYPEPLSRRLQSESNSGYVQGRNRLPLAVLDQALVHVRQWVGAQYTPEQLTWNSLVVRVLDGTSFRLLATPALVKVYGLTTNQHGVTHWVIVRSVMAFCLGTQTVVAHHEGRGTQSEGALMRPVLEADPVPGSVYVGDRRYGTYQVVQVAHALGHPVVLRLTTSVARRLLKTIGRKRLASRTEVDVAWTYLHGALVEADWPCGPLPGRLLYVRVHERGFRPFDVYLFTTLHDRVKYPLAALTALYERRWEGELDYRHVKTTLEMDEFAVKSPSMFQKELAAGLLTYNLICAWMVKAAQSAGITPQALSFSRCARRVREFVRHGPPSWVEPGQAEAYLVARLAQCRLPHQPGKVRHEPRQVRRKPAVYPALKGSRTTARRKIKREATQQH